MKTLTLNPLHITGTRDNIWFLIRDISRTSIPTLNQPTPTAFHGTLQPHSP
jgi:hypothetical protein